MLTLHSLPCFIQLRIRKGALPRVAGTWGQSYLDHPRSISLQAQRTQGKGAATPELDVTSPLSELHAVAAKAVAIYGHIDVVVNNAGYIISGAVEENRYVANLRKPSLP